MKVKREGGITDYSNPEEPKNTPQGEHYDSTDVAHMRYLYRKGSLEPDGHELDEEVTANIAQGGTAWGVGEDVAAEEQEKQSRKRKSE